MVVPIEIACSNANLPVPPQGTAFLSWSLANYQRFLEATGYANYELFIARSRLQLTLATYAKLGNFSEAQRLIGSVHQNFVTSSSGWKERLAMPSAARSLSTIYDIQTWTNKQLLAIVFPDALPRDGLLIEPDSMSPIFIAQPQPSVWDHFHLRAQAEEWKLFTRFGISGYCLDLFHYRSKSKNGYRLPRWQDTWPILLRSGQVYEIHCAAGRIDQRHMDPELYLSSRREGIALTASSPDALRRTELGDMLACIKENWVLPTGRVVGRIVSEIPAAFLHSIENKSLQQAHRRVTTNLYSLFSGAK